MSARLILTLMMLLQSAYVLAVEGDTFRPFVSYNHGYDSNLFRFANDNEARLVGLASPPSSPLSGITKIESVSYHRIGAGFDVDWTQGRQEVTGRVSADKTSFSRYSSLLDYSGRDIKGEWKWTLGNRWSGLLNGSQLRTLAPYTNQGTGTLDSNLRTEEKQAFQADYWFHPEWRARAKFERYVLGYSAPSQRARDRKRNTSTLGLYRLGKTVNQLGLELVDVQGSVPNISADFQERSLRLVGSWTLSGKTRLYGRVGYMWRTQSPILGKDYSGLEWMLSANWTPTGKTLIDASFYRDVRDSDTNSSSFDIADGLSLSATWLVWPKTRLQVSAKYERIDYDGSARRDDVFDSSLAATYEVWRGGDLSAGVQHSKRSSNLTDFGFSSSALFLNANLRF